MPDIHTECWTVDPNDPDPNVLESAGKFIRAGKLVAFPTETVYGLGANALDAAAVARIFAAKGRPATNPVIVHVSSLDQLPLIVEKWPETAEALARAFWPGPLTLILPKGNNVPIAVTAGGDTVAVRMPAHPVALRLIAAAGTPIAAPSANRSTEISPTTAGHVLKGLAGRIDLVLDGGSTEVGIESTVLDLTTNPPTIWRAGLVTAVDLAPYVGSIRFASTPHADTAAASPGLMRKHYAPRAEVVLVPRANDGDMADEINRIQKVEEGARIGVMALTIPHRLAPNVLVRVMPDDAVGYAHHLYAVLHHLEDAGCTHILIEQVPTDPEWRGVTDRLWRAAGK